MGLAQAQQITVSAAASLTNAFKDIAPLFEASRPGVTVRLNFAASGTLLQQMSQGAPVDVFASADQATMDRAAAQKLIDPATRRDFVTNSLVLIEPAQDGAGIQALADLQKPGVQKIAVGKTATVPAGRYTQEALESAGLWTALAPKYVQADSVRQVLDYVSRGEVEAGFVYKTDALTAGDKVRIVLTTSGHTPVSYPIAATANTANTANTDSAQRQLAQAFIDFLGGSQARPVLARYGFSQP
ncbi:MAG: molybdate ABC transporter substrate-binding protein [Comamonas sp.]